MSEKYSNIVGKEATVVSFIKEAKKSGIWTYKIYTVCVYMGVHYKGVFFKTKDTKKVKKLIKKHKMNLVLNASNPFC